MSPDERLALLANFRGYGDYKNSRFLYIGIEEGLAYNTEKDLEDVLRKFSKKDSPWEIPTPENVKPKNITERMQARLSIALLKRYGEPQVEKVDDYDLSYKNEFCANIYPFGANSQNENPSQYVELLGMEKKEEAQRSIDPQRKVLIKKMIDDFVRCEGGLVFIFGKKARAFLDNNQILEELEIEISDDQIKFDGNGTRHSPISYSTKLKVWLTGHPSHSWFNEDAIKKIVDKMAGGWPKSAQ